MHRGMRWTRHRLRGASHLLIVGALAVASLAGTADDPEITDPCGDSHTGVEAAGQDVEVPATREGHLDIERVWFEQHLTIVDGEPVRVDAVDVHLELCGDVPTEPSGFETWSVSWGLDDACWAGVVADGYFQGQVNPPEAGFRRDVAYVGRCSVPGATPFGNDVRIVFQADLDGAVTIDGRRITWSLRPDALPSDAAATLTRGTVWDIPGASASDGNYLFVATEHGDRAEIGPGTDIARGGRDVVIGAPGG